jgi:hypothetical protein
MEIPSLPMKSASSPHGMGVGSYQNRSARPVLPYSALNSRPVIQCVLVIDKPHFPVLMTGKVSNTVWIRPDRHEEKP